MIDAKELIAVNDLTEKEIERLVEDLKDELQNTKKVKYMQKVDAVRKLLNEMAEEYPNQLALEADEINIDKDVYWEDLIDIFDNTYHVY